MGPAHTRIAAAASLTIAAAGAATAGDPIGWHPASVEVGLRSARFENGSQFLPTLGQTIENRYRVATLDLAVSFASGPLTPDAPARWVASPFVGIDLDGWERVPLGDRASDREGGAFSWSEVGLRAEREWRLDRRWSVLAGGHVAYTENQTTLVSPGSGTLRQEDVGRRYGLHAGVAGRLADATSVTMRLGYPRIDLNETFETFLVPGTGFVPSAGFDDDDTTLEGLEVGIGVRIGF